VYRARFKWLARLLAASAPAAVLALGACGEGSQPPSHLHVPGGEPARGHALIQAYGCGACHVVEGVRGTRGTVGPPLEAYAERRLLAGILPNTPRFLVPWLVDPVAIEPRTGMPAVGVTVAEARHIAAYLYTLGDRTKVYPPDPPLDLRRP
jgi:mono/diheme cytochrome c family protein